MGEKFNLNSKSRELTGKKVKTLRLAGEIPAVIYGRSFEPQSISLNKKEFEKIYDQAGTSSLIDLRVDDKTPIKVLSHEPQFDPVLNSPIHADFYKVRMDEKITTEIPLEFIGESEAVEQLDGSLVTNRDAVEVECLPADLIPKIDVDISKLKTFEDSITVGDLKIPEGIEILTDKEEMIAVVEPPRSEEELAELEESAADEEKEALEKMEAESTPEGDDGEEGEEGEAKPEEPTSEEK